ncbi:MAG TPA: ABC transporter ATP-binding protein [Solirubrobacterales bacterium]|jgi:iron complex transport system ATP-binding protein|nr:ABC transporter ATP-binding protein [Solirubrobacterales bacterium]
MAALEGVPLLEAEGVEVEIAGTPILTGADLRLERGELVAVVGPNGAGKSTLVRAVAGLQGLSGGTVLWGGRSLNGIRGRELSKLRAFVPQRMPVPAGITVKEAVTIGRSSHLRMLGRLTRTDHGAIAAAIERAGVTQFSERSLTTLSGGELQRVQIAIGLAQEAPVLIADEPTSQLDLGATIGVASLLQGLVADGLTVLLVVHDLALALAVADTAVVVSDGRTVAAGAPAEVLTPERLADVWGANARLSEHDGRTALHVAWLAPAPS